MTNQLEQLKEFTTVVADTGDFEAIADYRPEDATTNPSLILKAIQLAKYKDYIPQAVDWARAQPAEKSLIELTADKLAVLFGSKLMTKVPGLVSTEVDARLSFNRSAMVAKAKQLISMYEQQGDDPKRVLIKLAATWEGIQAARELESQGIHTNVTLLFSSAQARASAEAGAYLISPFVGRILDWHKKQQPETDYHGDKDPGVQSVTAIYHYFKSHAYPTIVMGASFRNISEIQQLAGCDRLTISPGLLDELSTTDLPLARKLVPTDDIQPTPEPLSEAEFRWLLNEDAMATEKLAEGIRGFTRDQEKLEQMLSEVIG